MNEQRSRRSATSGTQAASASVDAFVTALSAGSTAFAIYPPSHPQARQALRELLLGFREASRILGVSKEDGEDTGNDALTLLVVDEDLVVQGHPWHRESPVARGLCKLFARAEVERVTIAPGVSAIELEQVVLGLAGRRALENTRHVTIGHLDVLPGEEAGDSASAVTSLERAADNLLAALRPLGPISDLEVEQSQTARIDRAAWKLMEATLNQPRAFLLQSSLVEATDAFWRHGIRTGLHTLALAKELGIEGGTLTDIVLAAVLHDLGRLQLSQTGQGEQATSLWRHTELGAERLANNNRLPPICALVAYEHHLFWDGTGGYPTPGRRPHLASQIVAVADAYDVVFQAAAGLPPATRRAAAKEGLARQSGLQPDLVAMLIAQQE